ncbi:MAG: methionine synthase, partial [Chloroflexi bacterium]|nr:methionine synthase [Chloroflexota bacterium]
VRSYGNRYYRKPIAVSPIGRPKPVTVEWFKYAQSLTRKPVKGMLTGPYTMVDWSFNEYYPTREAFVLAMAEVIHQEALDLEAAGARYIQIDEPAASTRPDELELVRRGLEIVTQGLSAYTITHICYGDFAAVYDEFLRLPVDQLDLELANSNYDLLDLVRQHGFARDLGLGVVDVHSHRIESVEEAKRGIRLALELLPPERIYVKPDCGLKTRTVEEAKEKMRVVAEAARQVRKDIGLLEPV